MSDNYTAWYRTGTVKVVKNSTAVVGTGTYWLAATFKPGDIFTTDGAQFYEILSVTDNTHLTLKTVYLGDSAATSAYAVIRNFTADMQADIAARTVELLRDIRRYIDEDMQNIHGKSAYEIACENGYVGTEAQWLESLIGAGQWVTLRDSVNSSIASFNTRVTQAESTVETMESRTQILVEGLNTTGMHNALFRGKSLGTFTEDMSTAISSGRFTDLWLGDSFTFSDITYTYVDENNETQSTTQSHSFTIAGFNLFNAVANEGIGNHIVIVSEDTPLYRKPMNDTDTNEGGYLGSKMHTVYMKQVIAFLKACFGADHVKTFKEYLSSSVSGGIATGHTLTDCEAMLLTETMLFGHPYRQEFGSGNYCVLSGQLPLFRLSPASRKCSNAFWLQDIAGDRRFSICYSGGDLSGQIANTNNNARIVAVIQ